jgi:hypothetical protein
MTNWYDSGTLPDMRFCILIVLPMIFGSSLCAQKNERESASSPTQNSDMTYFPGCLEEHPDSLQECSKKETARFIREHLVAPLWPDASFMENTSYVRYQIDSQGFVQNVEVVKTGGKQLDDAAINAIQKLPQHTAYTPEKENKWLQFIVAVKGGAHCIRKRPNFKE